MQKSLLPSVTCLATKMLMAMSIQMEKQSFTTGCDSTSIPASLGKTACASVFRPVMLLNSALSQAPVAQVPTLRERVDSASLSIMATTSYLRNCIIAFRLPRQPQSSSLPMEAVLTIISPLIPSTPLTLAVVVLYPVLGYVILFIALEVRMQELR